MRHGFYLTSLVMVAALLGPIVRSHWSIENSLHWVMDMMFRDDECRVQPTTHPQTSPPSNTWRTTFCEPPPARTHALRRKVAAWDDDFLAGLIAR